MRFVLASPPAERGIVVLAHGAGRFRPGGRAVAHTLSQARLATLDLLTVGPLPADDLVDAIDWLSLDAVVEDLPRFLGGQPLGCFGDGTAAAAALVAAAQRRRRVAAVVCRGGRPDLAAEALPRVIAPTLLIAGADDVQGIEVHRKAQAALAGEARLEIV